MANFYKNLSKLEFNFFGMINPFLNLSKVNRRNILILFDSLMFCVALNLSLFLTNINSINFKAVYIFIIFGIFINVLTGQYESITRYSSGRTLYQILWRNLLLTFLGYIYFILIPNQFNYTNLLIQFWIISSSLIIGSRTIFRELIFELTHQNKNKKKVIIYGAGEAGAQLASQLILSKKYKVLGFVDDQKSLWGRKIFNFKIYSKNYLIQFNKNIDQILLAIPSLKATQRKKFIDKIERYKIPILEVPSIEEIASGKAKLEELRKIEIEDLLGRESALKQVSPSINQQIEDSVVCITGAGGSIGSELCRQILLHNPKKLVLIEISEPSLYQITQELIYELNITKPLKAYLGNVTDKNLIDNIFYKESVDVVFHAAAYKHVPIVEKNPLQGILNNYLSTKVVCQSGLENNLKNIIFVSTDKAVRPTSVMGLSKRIAEIVVQYFSTQDHNTIYSMVRFGNVLGSSGSVVPLFKKQISKGGPVTLTDPNVIRYFMTIKEAVHLMIESLALAKGGDVFLLDMGKPIKILDLAKKMIYLSGLSVKDHSNPDGDIEILNIGLRGGEKLYEELLIDAKAVKTKNKKIFTAKEKITKVNQIKTYLNLLEKALIDNNEKEVLNISSKLVPEWESNKKNNLY